MKTTMVLLADCAAENFGRSIMLKAHRTGNTGFEMARLPQHVSLKQPFSVPSLEEAEEFFDRFAAKLSPVQIGFEKIDLFPSSVIGGAPSGCISLRVKENALLREMQRMLFSELEKRFGSCPAEHDNDYVFHMTVAIGGASFENYEKAFAALTADEELNRRLRKERFMFNRLGLLYYDDDNISPGTYFCYKSVSI